MTNNEASVLVKIINIIRERENMTILSFYNKKKTITISYGKSISPKKI